METVYEFSVDSRMRAVLSVKYPEKQVTKSGRVEHIPVRVVIPDEYVLQTPAIRLDEAGNLLFSSDNVYRPVLDNVISTGILPRKIFCHDRGFKFHPDVITNLKALIT